MSGEEYVWADSHIFMSPDLKHSNKMHQHAIEQLLEHYKPLFDAQGHPIEHVHIWSDGCAGQFKNRREFFWLTTGRTKYGLWMTHNFFQSCHGKGPSDSEAGVCKTGLNQSELLGTYHADSKAAYDWCAKNLSKPIEYTQADLGHKQRHSIRQRKFWFVDIGDVDHHDIVDPCPLDGSKSHFRFLGLEDCQVIYGEFSCYCPHCFRRQFTNCERKCVFSLCLFLTGVFIHRQTRPWRKKTMHLREHGRQATRSTDAKVFLQERALTFLKDAPPKSFVPVFVHPAHRDVRWHPDDPNDERECPYEVGQIIRSRQVTSGRGEQIEGEWVGRQTKVVDLYFLEAVKPGETYKFQNTPLEDDCPNLYQKCGPKRKEEDGGPCYKRHVRTVRLSALRPPCGLDVLRDTRRVSARNRNNRAETDQVRPTTVVTLSMPLGTKQVLENTLKEDGKRFGDVYVI